MKRIITVVLSVAMIFSLTACGEETVSENTEPELASEEANEESASGSNVLIVYFSRAENIDYDSGVDAVASASINADQDGNAVGNMRIIAEYLQEETKGDLFSIHTVDKYPKGYRDTTDQAADEKEEDARPELSNQVDNMEQYTTILLGASDIIRTS